MPTQSLVVVFPFVHCVAPAISKLLCTAKNLPLPFVLERRYAMTVYTNLKKISLHMVTNMDTDLKI
jgi:hypothetical protein